MRAKLSKRICSAILAVAMLLSLAPVTTFAITDEDIPASVELGKGFNLLECKTFESANLKSAILFDSVDTLNPTKVRIGNVESNMTYITSMSSYLDNTHTDISTEVGVTKEGLLAKAEVKAKFGFKGTWESSGTVNTSRLILEILAKAYKYSLNMEMSDPWAKGEDGEYVSLNSKFAYDLVHMRPEDLFNTYGTHIVTQYDAGGEAYTSYEGTDASNSMKSEFDITTNATVNVSAADIADVNVEVNASGGEKHEDSFANNNKQTSMRVRGGDPFYSTFDKIIAGDADETVNGWLQSMFTMDENTGSTKATMIQTDDLKLMPLWELLEMDYGRDHSERVAQLRDYFQENANREYLELYEEFIYGIPGDYADNYDVIREAMVTDENLGVVESAPSDRIPIYTEAELNKIGRSEDYPLDGKYTLMRDIEMKYDFGGIGYTTDKTIEPFTGDFDGNGHTIYDLNPIARYNGTSEVYMGFILYNKGKVYNLRFLNSNYDCREATKTTTTIKSNVANTAKAYLGLVVGRNDAEDNTSNVYNIYVDNATFIVKNAPKETYFGLVAGYFKDTVFTTDVTVVNSYVDVSGTSDSGTYYIGGVCGQASTGGGMISHDNVVKCDKNAYVGGCLGYFNSTNSNRMVSYAYDNEVSSANSSNLQLAGSNNLNAYTVGGADSCAIGETLFKYYCDKSDLVGGMGGYAEEWTKHSETESKPWLIVHAPDGMTAYQNSLISMKNLKVYFAQYGDEIASYEDVTDRVNFVYDFSEIAEDVPVTVVYGKHLVEFTVDVVEPVVTDIAITNKGKTQFRVGEKFDNSLFEGQILYSNNLTSSLSASDEGLTVYIPELEGDNPINVGEYKFIETSTGTDVVVEYKDYRTTYQISVLPEDLEGKLHFSSSSVESAPGGEFEITIDLNNNPGIVALSAYIEYDNDLFEVVEVKDEGLLPSFQTFADYKPSVPLLWMDATATEDNKNSDDKLVTVKFKVKEGNYDVATYGMYTFKCVNGEAVNKKGEIIEIPDMAIKVKLNETTVGDVDSNSAINIWDTVLLTRYAVDNPDRINIDGINLTAADVNRDEDVNDVDSTVLSRYIVGLFGLTGAPGKFDVRVDNEFFEDEILTGLVVNSDLPQPEEKFGYVFDGYYSDAEYTKPIEKLPAKSVREIVIYAKYKEGYIIDSSLELENNIHVFGQETPLVSEGVTLWNVYDDNRLIYRAVSSIPANYKPTTGLRVEKYVEDLTGKTFSITYEENGVECTYATENPIIYTYGVDTAITSPVSAANTSTGYNVVNFAGWYTNPEFDGLPVTNMNGRSGDITLYAKWDRWTCKINLDAKGGNSLGYMVHTYGTETKLPTPTHSNPDYTFVRWVHNGDTITSIPATAYNSSKTYTYNIYAEWAYEPKITLTLTGSATNPDSKTEVTVENVDAYNKYSIAEPSTSYVVAADGKSYLFMGWYSKDTGAFVTKQYLENVEIDLNLEAKWEWFDTRLKVNFLDTDGTLIETVRVEYSEDLNMVESIKSEKDGHKLAGWTTEVFDSDTGALPYYPLYVPLDNVHNGVQEFNFYAYWVPEENAVQYTYSNDATGVISSGFDTMETKVRLTPRDDRNWKITGIPYAELRVPANVYTYERTIWLNAYSQYGFTSEIDSGALGVSWLIYNDGSKYLMRYNHNGGSGNLWAYGRSGFGLTGSDEFVLYDQANPPHTAYTGRVIFKKGQTPPAITDPAAREGFTFVGWYDNPEFTGDPITEIPTDFRGDLIIYAKWIATN